MLYICIFSNKLDLNQAIRVSHISVKNFIGLTQDVESQKEQLFILQLKDKKRSTFYQFFYGRINFVP
jgi:hypothetical protein